MTRFADDHRRLAITGRWQRKAEIAVLSRQRAQRPLRTLPSQTGGRSDAATTTRERSLGQTLPLHQPPVVGP